MATMTNYTPAEQELTCILLTELLAHQFCFPVQWIKTQDSILKDFATERLIEVGPGETLIHMAQKTLKEGYESHDIALGLRRELLSHKKDSSAILYDQSNQGGAASAATTDAALSALQASPADAPDQESAPAQPMPPPVAAPKSIPVSVPDKAVSSLDVITTLVAVTLKKQASDVAQDMTIKALCGGRSTLQNEIIGDLVEELGSLPDQAEDITLSDLATTLSSSTKEMKLGARTSALISKMTTSRMPAGSSVTVLRQYLYNRWDFKHGLQDRALLLAVSRPPLARLANEKDVHLFLDNIARDVLKSIGVDPARLSSGGVGPQDESAGVIAVSSAALDTIQSEWRKKDKSLLDVYAKHVGHDINGASSEKIRTKATIDQLQAKNDAWSAEHGEAYERGITPAFDLKKVRKYDSYWNWAVQQVVVLLSTCLVGQLEKFASQAQHSLDSIPPRANPHLLQVIGFLLRAVKNVPEADSARLQAAQEWLLALETACKCALSQESPSFRYSVMSTVPILDVGTRGQVSVKEVPRMIRPSDTVSELNVRDGCDGDDARSVADTGSYYAGISTVTPSVSIFTRHVAATAETLLSSVNSDRGGGTQGLASPQAASSYLRMASMMWTPELKTKGRGGWHTNYDVTNGYLRWFQKCSIEGLSFGGKAILVTGAGRMSIGSEVVAISLAAGAKVLVTTSSYGRKTCDFYKDLYQEHGARGSQLVLVPFNGGSVQDVRNLVKYVYDDEGKGGLGWDLDHIVPFAAVGLAGRAVDNIDDRSELAQRVMLTNVVRLLGAVKSVKAQRRITTHPTHVLLPLSPNHGVFGQDGLYAESKIALEPLLNKWWSEDWSEYLALCGVIIGWTRGTGLMSNNDVLATGVEADLGIRTFSAAEMAWHIIGLMDTDTASLCDLEPLMVDLSGGLSAFANLKPVLQQIQDRIDSRSDVNMSIYKEQLREADEFSVALPMRVPLRKKATTRIEQANLPEYAEIESLASRLEGMVDLERVVVVVGFGEVGPYGSSRTRWETETAGTFSLSGCVELAWIMGLVKYHNGRLDSEDYCGWIETSTKTPITDTEIKAKYEGYMAQHTGIRLVERRDHDLAPPDQQQKLHEVVVTEDMEPFEVPLGTAEEMKREHGDKAIITETEGGQFSVILKAGATVWIPKASKSQSIIGAQIPAGWDPRTYGIPEDVISQVDPVTLYALVATVEAFLCAGITDPYELYRYMHVSDLGNALGTSLGGAKSLDSMFKRRYLDAQVQNDVLAETFVNTTAAWVNMLLLGCSGPIRTPVGACATALESLDTGCDLILNGRAKAVLVGGTDALERDVAHEFARMKATINAVDDAAAGRTPREASRPTTSTRAGFVEAEGCGVQLLTTARLALDMGLPIRGVIALTHTASDRIGRSLPSPGKGVLTIAAEDRSGKFASPLLDMQHRRRRLALRLRQIEEKLEMELAWLEDRLKATTLYQGQQRRASESGSPTPPNPEESAENFRSQAHAEARRARQEARNMYGNQFWKHDDSISPLRGALAVWGLTIDDLTVGSLHGTSTMQNDTNETAVLQRQLSFLGRSTGNVMPCCLQKAVLGHGKGAAGAFAVNSCLQMLATGLVPGNHNADNIDAALEDRDLLFFPSKTYKSPGGVKAFSVTSFGFGQKGAQVIGINAKYLFATLSREDYESYRLKVRRREADADRALQKGMYGGRLVKLKDKNVYEDDRLEEALLYRS